MGGLSRGQMSLAEVQCHLDKEGASDLVIDLIMNTTSDRVFQESILLAIALLEGGNTTIQVSVLISVCMAKIFCTLVNSKLLYSCVKILTQKSTRFFKYAKVKRGKNCTNKAIHLFIKVYFSQV